MQVRTRFAPSPTGMLHVGSVRTALFAWLYAKHCKGEFILRIEDTDSMRSTKEAVDVILEGMQWLGLSSELPTYYQTKHYDRYKEIIDDFLKNGIAYRCYCTEERLVEVRNLQLQTKQKPKYDNHCRDKNYPHDSSKPYVIRFKTPLDGFVEFEDAVYGNIKVENTELDDLVLVRSDGHPTYNFAVVVDDYDMKITHVIRGDDHINNTPKQIHIFNALKAKLPIFAHLPMILGDDGKKLSKRHGAVSILEFKNDGILPHALLNYLVRLGWSHGNQEIFSLQEMIEFFDFKNISKSAAAFQYDKLYWLNQHYLKTDSLEYITNTLKDFFIKNKHNIENGPKLHDVVEVYRNRCKTILQIYNESKTFYEDIAYNDFKLTEVWSTEIEIAVQAMLENFKNITDWSKENIHAVIDDICNNYELKLKQIAPFIRMAVTGNINAPSLDVLLLLLGKHKTIFRLDSAMQFLNINTKKA